MQRISTDKQSETHLACCVQDDFLLAEKFDLATALVDVHAQIKIISTCAKAIVADHPALLQSTHRIGLMSSTKTSEFRVALRYVLSGQPAQTLRADDGCMGVPLALQISNWNCSHHCLVSFQVLEPSKIDLSHLSNPFDLTRRQLELLELFTAGLSFADIAQSLGLKPQTIREAFCDLYARFELRNQLELLSALRKPALVSAAIQNVTAHQLD
jgi:DNA-binding NarL/FixJ family response regulator